MRLAGFPALLPVEPIPLSAGLDAFSHSLLLTGPSFYRVHVGGWVSFDFTRCGVLGVESLVWKRGYTYLLRHA